MQESCSWGQKGVRENGYKWRELNQMKGGLLSEGLSDDFEY